MRKKQIISYAQAQLPFNGNRGRILAVPFKQERMMLIYLAGAVVILSVLYGAFVGISVAQVASRESTLKASRTLSADVAVLEGQYLAETRGITEGYAKEEGFVPPVGKVFVTRLSSVSFADTNAR